MSNSEENYNQTICRLAGISDPERAPYVLEERTVGFTPRNKVQVLVWAGPSGAGKGTIAEFLRLPRIPRDVGETRGKRPGEVHGVDYYFRTDDEFRQMIADEEFIWWTKAQGGGYRGLSREAVRTALANHPVGYIDAGGESAIALPRRPALREYGLATVMILPPSFAELKRRLGERFMADAMASQTAEIERRLRLATRLLELTEGVVDIYLVNDDIEQMPEKVARLRRQLNLA